MKKYLLLRDNRESGPYTFEEIAAKKLKPCDLIWIEGESASWLYPTEVSGLEKLVVTATEKRTSAPVLIGSEKQPEMVQPASISEPRESIKESSNPVQENQESSKDFAGTYPQTQTLWSKKVIPNNNVLKVAAVFIGLLIGAFCMKKMVDGIVDSTMGSEKPGDQVQALAIPAPENAGIEYQNALVTMITQEEPKATIASLKPMTAKEIVKQLKLTSSQGQTSVANSKKGVALTLANGSSHLVNQAEIEVRYVNASGDVILTEVYPVKSLKANSSRTIHVPSNGDAEKIRYKLINVLTKRSELPYKIV